MEDGDRAKWVTADATSCDSSFDASPVVEIRSRAASFSFPSAAGALVLCYKFSFGGKIPATPYLLFPQIRAAVLRYDTASPYATGVGCASTITISGGGFRALGIDTPSNVSCGFSGLGRAVARVLNDTHLTCVTPSPTSLGTYPLRIDFHGYSDLHTSAFSNFLAFDASLGSVAAVLPAGGAYNLEASISVFGATLRDYGAPRCRFGTHIGGWATVTNSTHVTCGKPRFPDSERSAVGTFNVSFSPNGQCFPSTLGSAGSFHIYNSQVTAVAVGGGPATSSISLEVVGEGLVGFTLPGGLCRFDLSDGTKSFTAVLSVASATTAYCPTPGDGTIGTWYVSVLQNGLSAEPTLYGSPTFSTYDISTVRVSSINPPGGATGASTAVTISGSGFADYGAGQLSCRVSATSGSTLVSALMLSASQVMCTLPAGADAESIAVTVSLNNGTAGSFSPDEVAFVRYPPPLLNAVSPNRGEAGGGELIRKTQHPCSSPAFTRCR